MDAWLSICSLANCVVSSAKSASSIPPCAADRLAEILVRLLTVWNRRFDTAPNFQHSVLTLSNDVSVFPIAITAFSRDETSIITTSLATL